LSKRREVVHGKTKRFDFMQKLMEDFMTYVHPKDKGIVVRTRRTPEKTITADRWSGKHFLERLMGNTRLVCVVCKADSTAERNKMAATGLHTEYTKPKRTQFKCHTCLVPLCMGCMARYHEEGEIVGLDVGPKRVRKCIRL
jgi:hypothetical protein